jgi:hypothetical protein
MALPTLPSMLRPSMVVGRLSANGADFFFKSHPKITLIQLMAALVPPAI